MTEARRGFWVGLPTGECDLGGRPSKDSGGLQLPRVDEGFTGGRGLRQLGSHKRENVDAESGHRQPDSP